MSPADLEIAISGQLTPALMVPVFAFSQHPNAVEMVGEKGIALVIYDGSKFDGNAAALKRTLQSSLLMIAVDPDFIHQQMQVAAQSLVGGLVDGCRDIRLISDELAVREDGLFQAMLVFEVDAFGV